MLSIFHLHCAIVWADSEENNVELQLFIISQFTGRNKITAFLGIILQVFTLNSWDYGPSSVHHSLFSTWEYHLKVSISLSLPQQLDCQSCPNEGFTRSQNIFINLSKCQNTCFYTFHLLVSVENWTWKLVLKF